MWDSNSIRYWCVEKNFLRVIREVTKENLFKTNDIKYKSSCTDILKNWKANIKNKIVAKLSQTEDRYPY